MKNLFPLIVLSAVSSVGVGAQTLTHDGLEQICASQGSGSQMVNLTDGGEFMFLTDATGVTYRTFIANGQEIDFTSMSDFWQEHVIDGLKYNYDVIACVSQEGKVNSKLGILTTLNEN